MKFNIVEDTTDNTPYEDIKQDYIACELTIVELREKYGLSVNNWDRIRRQFKREGVPMRTLQKRAVHKHYRYPMGAKNYYQTNKDRWVVYKRIRGKPYYFGSFDTEKEAKERVKELKESNWEGLL